MYLDDLKKENCCGCMACAMSCPVSVITMEQDTTGFYYPKIKEELCIHCNLCRKVCPLNENYVGQDADPDIYAVRNRSEDVLQKSSSGGVFSMLADWVLAQGGVVYGVAFDESFAVRHERAMTREEAERFRTSKYVESDLTAVYEEAHEVETKEKIEGRDAAVGKTEKAGENKTKVTGKGEDGKSALGEAKGGMKKAVSEDGKGDKRKTEIGCKDGIESDLAAGKTVLLTGTPCQIAGVTSYLRQKHANTEKLYTCDNVCHGVPSRKVWDEYLALMREKYIGAGDEISFINMRSKSVSWDEKKFEIALKNGNIDDVVEKMSFNKMFSSLVANRPACFACHFTSYRRPSDFTLGDFWNAESAGVKFDTKLGISEVFVNTPKAQTLFREIRESADVQRITKQQAWQPHLEYAAKRPKSYERFWEEYLAAEDKESTISRYVKGSFVTQVIRAASPILRKTGLYNLAGKLYRVVFVRK